MDSDFFNFGTSEITLEENSSSLDEDKGGVLKVKLTEPPELKNSKYSLRLRFNDGDFKGPKVDNSANITFTITIPFVPAVNELSFTIEYEKDGLKWFKEFTFPGTTADNLDEKILGPIIKVPKDIPKYSPKGNL